MSFRGLSKVTLDAKGRLAIPSRYRDEIISRSEGKLVATVNTDLSLLIYPEVAWDEVERELLQLPNLHEETERLQELLLGHAMDMELDNQGRVLVPRELREFAGLEQKAMLIGRGKRFALWDEQRYLEHRTTLIEKKTSDFKDLPDSLARFKY